MAEYAKDVLVTTEWLAEHLNDASVVVAEVDEDPDLYEGGHKEAFERLMGRLGISNASTVVLYGDKNNWFAAFAYWYLKVYGHEDVRVLDGGRQKWLDERREVTTDVPSPERAEYRASERNEALRAYRGAVLEGIGASEKALVDVRSPQEYAGDLVAPPGYEQEGAQRAGHIPTAVSIPWSQAARDDGTFRPREELLELYESEGITAGKHVTAYCRIGERSAHTWFVLRELLGYEHVDNYDGFVDGVGQPRGRADRAELAPKAPLAAPTVEDVRALPVRPSQGAACGADRRGRAGFARASVPRRRLRCRP
jgi:thiosulfate/3-mercaptopyruvate sulfurtransferase